MLISLLVLVLIAIIVMPFVIIAKVNGLRRRSERMEETLGHLHGRITSDFATLGARFDGLSGAPGEADSQTETAGQEVTQTEDGGEFDESLEDVADTPEVAPGGYAQKATSGEFPTHTGEEDDDTASIAMGGVEEVTADANTGDALENTAPLPDPEPRFESPAYQPQVREKSGFEKAAAETLRKIWSYIVVGEEHRPVDVSVEYAIATTWLVRVGVFVLVIGIGFFLKYSIERDLIPPPGRVGIAIFVGSALLFAGIRLLGNRYHLLGQGLMGAGIATLYFSVFAAANFYHLISAYTAFGLMAAITVCAGVLAVRLDSILVAILGIVGGYGTPIMLATGSANFVGLFSYMLMLGVGVLGITLRKRWHLLNYLSFIFTYGLFVAAVDKYYGVADFPVVISFLVAFFALFSTMVFIHNLANGTKSNLLDVLALITNAGIFFWFSYELIRDAYRVEWVAAVTLGLTIFYLLHVRMFLTRQLRDRELLVSFTGLSAFFLTITMPIVLSSQWLTSSWSIQALVMLWMAGKMRSAFLRQAAYLIYAFVIFRFAFVDLGGEFRFRHMDAELSLAQYVLALIERLVAFLVPVASLAGAATLLRRPGREFEVRIDKENDVPDWLKENLAVRIGLGGAVVLLFVYLNFELNRTLYFMYPPVRLPLLTILWVAMSGVFLALYQRMPERTFIVLCICMTAAVVAKLIAVDLASWNFAGSVYAGGYSFLDASMRTLDFAVIIAFLVVASLALKHEVETAAARLVFAVAAIALFFLYATFELNTLLLHFVPGLRAGGITILWALFAIAFLLSGIRRSITPLRFTGLILFLVVAIKIFAVDLRHSDQIYRIVAFILLGALILTGSFIYIKYRHTFIKDADEPPDEGLTDGE